MSASSDTKPSSTSNSSNSSNLICATSSHGVQTSAGDHTTRLPSHTHDESLTASLVQEVTQSTSGMLLFTL